MIVRALSWPADRPRLEQLDLTFSTDLVYDVQSQPHGFALIARQIAPALRKTYHVAWNELLTDSVAVIAERDNCVVGVAVLQYVAWNRRAILTHLAV